MSVAVFAGPSLPPAARSGMRGITWWPPARQGDFARALARRPDAIGLIDGVFDSMPTVWHKEILAALDAGIPVFGAASIGALRAAELDLFGMIGVGAIYRQFSSGELTDDDEVALLHGPEETGYLALTEPMVNVRATLARAVAMGVTDAATAALVTNAAKAIFFKHRRMPRVLAAAAEQGTDPVSLARLATWLPANRIDQKREDARALIAAIAPKPVPLADRLGLGGLLPTRRFAPQPGWRHARQWGD